jgi:hypothetical protein
MSLMGRTSYLLEWPLVPQWLLGLINSPSNGSDQQRQHPPHRAPSSSCLFGTWSHHPLLCLPAGILPWELFLNVLLSIEFSSFLKTCSVQRNLLLLISPTMSGSLNNWCISWLRSIHQTPFSSVGPKIFLSVLFKKQILSLFFFHSSFYSQQYWSNDCFI